jgi:aminoglycoside phosphotransferase (APT) family kinase protein
MAFTGASYPRHNWLPAAIPADARRFRVADPRLGQTLVTSGAELVETDPEVALGPADVVGSDAPYVVVGIEHIPREGGFRLMRAARRATRSLALRVSAERARRILQARSYTMSTPIYWEWEQAVRLPWIRASPKHLWSGRFPLGALVIGSRRGRPPTILEVSSARAGEQIGAQLDYGWPLATQAGLVVIANQGVLRVAVGSARQHLHDQREVLRALEASGPPAEIARLIPGNLADGTTGLANWSLEKRLPGTTAPSTLPQELLEESISFLAALAELGNNSKRIGSPVADAEVIAKSRSGGHVGFLGSLGRYVEEILAPAPRVFAHGDFWSRNLLIENRRLTGVVDWDHGGPGRLPLLDLLQLRLNMVRAETHQFLGPALVEHLLPWASSGGDHQLHAFAGRLGIEVSPPRLEAFVVAYWLDRVAHELSSYADRTERPVWMRQNVDFVLDAIGQAGILNRLRALAAL